jgi:hypothetical protein
MDLDAASGSDHQYSPPMSVLSGGLGQSAAASDEGLEGVPRQRAGPGPGFPERVPHGLGRSAAAPAASQASLQAQPPGPSAGEPRQRPTVVKARRPLSLQGAGRGSEWYKVRPLRAGPDCPPDALSTFSGGNTQPPPQHDWDGGAVQRVWNDSEDTSVVVEQTRRRSDEAAPPEQKSSEAAVGMRRWHSTGGVSGFQNVVLVARSRPPATAAAAPAAAPQHVYPLPGEAAASPRGPTPHHHRHAQFEQHLDELLAEVAEAARVSVPATLTAPIVESQ